ncbi:MAG: helix-turn-helix transcriptional regulator [Gammaproteobacteria bacterium]|nr:helix-turn-helix transcriptional regulator [Gammaproteobacteria bacterium]
MNLRAVGQLVARRRREQGLTLSQLATAAGIGRSTLAALESGKLTELGFGRVARLCAAVDLIIDVRPPLLAAPLMAHRHLTDIAGRELSKTAIEDVITRGDFEAWRRLVRAMRDDPSGRIGDRVLRVARALSAHDPRARAFASLTPRLLRQDELAAPRHV